MDSNHHITRFELVSYTYSDTEAKELLGGLEPPHDVYKASVLPLNESSSGAPRWIRTTKSRLLRAIPVPIRI